MNDNDLKVLEDFNSKLAEVEKHVDELQKIKTHLEFYDAEEKKVLLELKALGIGSVEELVQKIKELEDKSEKVVATTINLSNLTGL